MSFKGRSLRKPLILKYSQYLEVLSRLMSVLPSIYIASGARDAIAAVATLPPGKQLSTTIEAVTWM